MSGPKLTALERDFLERLRLGRGLRPAFRDEDRARQKCRRAGLAIVIQNPRRWELTDAGLAALNASKGE